MIRLAGRKALVFGGATGLLGQSLCDALRAEDVETIAATRDMADLLDPGSVRELLARHEPDLVLNTVAYTQVDQAEDEPELAAMLNAGLPEVVGRQCRERGILLVHYSTDFVFGGEAEHPYGEDAPTDPRSVYGRTKLRGETALRSMGYANLLILRTAWLFGPRKTNFVHKILGLAKEREELSVVHDQIGSPTYAPDLARHTLDLVKHDRRGLYHLANAGQASWCELATEAVAAAGLPCRVVAVPTSAYPTKATRPAYSVLDTSRFSRDTGMAPRPWGAALREYVMGLLAAESGDQDGSID